MNRRIGLVVLFACVVEIPEVALAQAFPTKPIRVIVPFTAGGTVDPMMRRVAEPLAKGLGQPVLVENKPGGGTVIAIDFAAKSNPDGYTLVIVSNSFTANHTLVPKLPYDTLKDLRPVGLMTRMPNVLVGNPGVMAKNLGELIAYAKANPGKLSYASTGNGSVAHLMVESLKSAAGVNILHVPYRGAATADLLGGQIDLMVGTLPPLLQHIRSGRIKSFGVANSTRTQAAPELPTVAEQGYLGFDFNSWYGLAAPAAVPDQIVARLNTELVRALSSSEIRKSFVAQGIELIPGTSEELGAHIRSEIAKYAKVIKEANIKLD
jgi:tripartite-type tricarboxylate transporter receptor subunit TctC